LPQQQRRARAAKPRKVRTDRDWIMICLGICLTLVLSIIGYLSITEGQEGSPPRIRGPVRDPASLGLLEKDPMVVRYCSKQVLILSHLRS
jgi:hypothetical protein